MEPTITIDDQTRPAPPGVFGWLPSPDGGRWITDLRVAQLLALVDCLPVCWVDCWPNPSTQPDN